MNVLTKTLVVTENYISGNLVSLKLQSMGFEVVLIHTLDEGLDLLAKDNFDLIILENCPNLQKLIKVIGGADKSLIYLEEDGIKEKKNSINVSFKEEDFLHMVSFLAQATPPPPKNENSFIDEVVSHYGGDEKLAFQVCRAFMAEWQENIDRIKDAFANDEDVVLAKKLHSFKGVLSALGKTAAAKCIIRMEILVKGQLRNLSLDLMDELLVECHKISQALSEYS